ncbi:MAG TPA: DUF4388 domain-containing protein [Anaeromyxobacter sp.]
MSLPSHLDGLPEVKGALTVAPDGRLMSADGAGDDTAATAAALVVALRSFAAAGDAAHLGALVTTHLKGTTTSIVTGSRGDALLLVNVDPARGTGAVEKAVKAWTQGVAAPPPPRTVVHHGVPTPAPRPAIPQAAAAPSGSLPARPPGTSPGFAPPPPVAAAAAEPRPTPSAGVRDPWAALRRALGRGQLTEAAALKYELAAAANPGRAGCEPVSREECDHALQALLEGVGSVMAGDGLGGARTLKDLATDRQPNLSFRWLALHWSARAAMRSGGIPVARAHVQAALTLARQLDVEARALSQWTAAEVLAHDSDSTRALAWLSESRARFERAGDRWGVGQTWITEARVLTALDRAGPAADAARAAAEMLPESDEPTVLLSRLALLHDDVDGAEALVRPLRTQAAEKVRALIEAIRGGLVKKEDVGEFLREHDAAPSQRSLRALTRIAASAPRFLQAREALAWMLLRLGKYDEAGGMFRALLSQPLSSGDRASIMLGLGCIANAGRTSVSPLRAVVAQGSSPVSGAATPAPPLPPIPQVNASAILARGAASGVPDAVFSGQLSSFALPDLLEFLRSGRRTGLLVCSSASGMGALRFREGRITGAASPRTPALGEFLVRGKKITAQALRALTLADAAEQPDDVLGERIVSGGLADVGAVQEALEHQVWAAIRELVGWTDGEFAFNREEEADPAVPRLAIALDPQAVLLDVFRENDEQSRNGTPPAAHS